MRTISFLILLSAFVAGNSFGQEKAADKQTQLEDFYRVSLNTDTRTASGVAQTMQVYKTAMAEIEADTTLTVEVKREKYRALAEQKNRKLRTLLNPAQQEKIIPSAVPALPADSIRSQPKINLSHETRK